MIIGPEIDCLNPIDPLAGVDISFVKYTVKRGYNEYDKI